MAGCKFSVSGRCALIGNVLCNGQSERKDCPLWVIAEAINTVARIFDAFVK